MTVIGEAWVKVRGDVAGFGKDAERAISGEMGPVAEAEGHKHGGLFGRAFSGGAGDGMSGLKMAVLGSTAAIGAGVLAAGVGLYKLGADFKDVSNDIRVKTGATGAQLDALNTSFKNVAKQVPESFKESGAVVADLAQKLNLTGKPLENLSVQFLNLAHVTKGDVNAQMDAAVQVFRNFGVTADQQGPVLDKLFRASQASGVGFDQLTASMTAAGPTLRGMGLDVDHSAAFIAALSKAGVDASQVMPALGKAAATAAKEHKSAGELFQDTFTKIKNAKTDVEASGDAVAIFGAKAGPRLATLIREGKLSMDDMLKSISGGKDTINKATSDTEDFGEKWDKIKNQVLVGLEPAASAVFDAVGKGMDWISEHGPDAVAAIGGLVDAFSSLFDSVGGPMAAVQIAWGSLMDGFTGGSGTANSEVGGLAQTFARFGETAQVVFTNVQNVVQGVVAFMSQQWEAHEKDIKQIIGQIGATFESFAAAVQAIFEKIEAVVSDIWNRFGNTLLGKLRVAIDAIIEIVKGMLEFLKGIFDLITAILTGKWGKAWDAILEILHGAWDQIKGIIRLGIDEISMLFELAKALISAAWAAIWHGIATMVTTIVIDPAKGAFDDLVRFITGMPGRIKSAAVGMFDGLRDAFKSAINWIINAWNNFHIPSFTIGGWSTPFGDLPSYHTPQVDFPDIPLLAEGGIVTAPTLAMIGEAGPEAVIPLSQAGSALGDLLGTLPRGWTLSDYVSNLVRSTSIALQSSQVLIADWIDRTARMFTSALSGDITSVVAALDPLDKSLADVAKAASDAGSAVSSLADSLASSASQAQSQQQQQSNSNSNSQGSKPTPTLGGPDAPIGAFGVPATSVVHDGDIIWGANGPLPVGTLYDVGGWLMPGTTLARNETGAPERILTASQYAALAGGSSQPIVLAPTFELHGTSEELVTMIEHANRGLVDDLVREMAAGFAPGSV